MAESGAIFKYLSRLTPHSLPLTPWPSPRPLERGDRGGEVLTLAKTFLFNSCYQDNSLKFTFSGTLITYMILCEFRVFIDVYN